MSNEEKAKEIAKKHHVLYDDYYDSTQECIDSSVEAMEWKDNEMRRRLKDFVNACKPLDSDIQKIVNEHFWDLV